MSLSCEVQATMPNPASACNFANIFFSKVAVINMVQLVYAVAALLYELHCIYGILDRVIGFFRKKAPEEQPREPSRELPRELPIEQPTVVAEERHPASIREDKHPASIPDAPRLDLPEDMMKAVQRVVGGFFGGTPPEHIHGLGAAVLFGVDAVLRMIYTTTANTPRTIYFMEFAYPLITSLAALALLLKSPHGYKTPLTGYIMLHFLRVSVIVGGEALAVLQKV